MSVTVIAFVVMAFVVSSFYAATLIREWDLKPPSLTQAGGGSLSRPTVSWLAAGGFISALVIYFVLR